MKKPMITNLKTIGIGLAGVSTGEVVNQAMQFDPTPITQGVDIVTKIIILVGTLIALFRKKKEISNS